jgi:hypothetical protein
MPAQIGITKRFAILLFLVCLAVTVGCAGFQKQSKPAALAQHSEPAGGEAEILQSWQGDFPVAQLKLLPEGQREKPVGFINDAKTFEGIWKAFKPVEAIPEIDFKANLVLFARNTQFYNRIRIGKVSVKNGVAEVLTMETMSAAPIEHRTAMSLAVFSRKGISGIQVGDEVILMKDNW